MGPINLGCCSVIIGTVTGIPSQKDALITKLELLVHYTSDLYTSAVLALPHGDVTTRRVTVY